MATVALMLGGAVVNALAFTGGNYLFSSLGSNSDEERERHDKAMEDLQSAQAEWSKKRTERLDFITEQMQKEKHAVQTFDNVDKAMEEYYDITGQQLDPLPPEPRLSDFYTPSPDQQKREIVFIVLGMTLTGYAAYKLL